MKEKSDSVSAYDFVFPVYGGEITEDDLFDSVDIFGTAFYIGHNFFLTSAYTIDKVLKHPEGAIGYRLRDRNKISLFKRFEKFENHGFAIIEVEAEIAGLEALKWKRQKQGMLTNVITMGYGFGWKDGPKEIIVRSFKGYIIQAGKNYDYFGNPQYELSFHIPRSVSGAPLIDANGPRMMICGMIIGNELQDISLLNYSEEKEIQKQNRITDLQTQFPVAIALQTESFLNIQSSILGSTLIKYFYENQLLSDRID